MRTSRDMALIVCLLLVTACGSTVPSSAPSPSVGPVIPARVVLGLYSGRPDPDWMLTAEQADHLAQALGALPAGTGTPPVGGLGYHGFTILFPGGTLVAYRGIVAPPGDGSRGVKEDPTRSIERYLLETSQPHVTADEYAEAQRALTAP